VVRRDLPHGPARPRYALVGTLCAVRDDGEEYYALPVQPALAALGVQPLW
jgi:hypothetical protein